MFAVPLEESVVVLVLRILSSVYYRPTDLTRFALMISAVIFVHHENNTPAQLRLASAQSLVSLHRHCSGRSLSTHLSVPTPLASPIMEILIMFFSVNSTRKTVLGDELAMKPRHGPCYEVVIQEMGAISRDV
jgi:hypothetical protein